MTADMTGDGFPDLLTVANTSGVLMQKNNADGSFADAIEISPGAFLLPRTLAAADFDGDDKLDLVVGESHGLALALQADPWAISTFAEGSTSFDYMLAAADVNGDGLPDIVDLKIVDDSMVVAIRHNQGCPSR